MAVEFASCRNEILTLQRTLRMEAGDRLLMRWADRRRLENLEAAWAAWVHLVRETNMSRMEADSVQWALHAKANSARDLQAWYHATFAPELYRLRGKFWYKEAILPEYEAHPIRAVGDEANNSPGAILCAPNAIYTAMAATMYTIRATLTEKEYALFEKLTTDGVTVLKYPFRSGRPQKKHFQLSLVQGDLYLYMYLTWKGKHGMQGIELASVQRVADGVNTEVLKRTAKADKLECYLSLLTNDRSLDLCFDTAHERQLWESTLSELIRIEKDVRASSLRANDTLAVDRPEHSPGLNDD